jgi:hypothetical protein
MSARGKTAIVAVGGNALIVDDQHQSIPDQYKAAAVSSRYVADMVEAGVTVIYPRQRPAGRFILRRPHRESVAGCRWTMPMRTRSHRLHAQRAPATSSGRG